jgi:hypothetical protein
MGSIDINGTGRIFTFEFFDDYTAVVHTACHGNQKEIKNKVSHNDRVET